MLLCSLPRTERVCPHVYQDLPIWCTTVQLSHGFKDPGIKTGDDLFPLSALLNYLSRRGNKAGTLFKWSMAPHCQKQNSWMQHSSLSSTSTSKRLCRT